MAFSRETVRLRVHILCTLLILSCLTLLCFLASLTSLLVFGSLPITAISGLSVLLLLASAMMIFNGLALTLSYSTERTEYAFDDPNMMVRSLITLRLGSLTRSKFMLDMIALGVLYAFFSMGILWEGIAMAIFAVATLVFGKLICDIWRAIVSALTP